MTGVSGLNEQAARRLAALPAAGSRGYVDPFAAIAGSRAREADRVNRLVLGRPRPMPSVDTAGLNKQERKAARHRVARQHAEQLKDDRQYMGKEATPETLRDVATRTEGGLARLYATGDIDADQLAAAEQIVAAHQRVVGDVTIAIASLEARVDRSPQGDGSFYEALGAVQTEVAYTRWREALAHPAVVLDMIVGGLGFTVAARRNRMAHRRAKRLLIVALDLWPRTLAAARNEVDPATLAAAHAGIL